MPTSGGQLDHGFNGEPKRSDNSLARFVCALQFSDVDFDLTDLEVPNVAGELPVAEVPTEAEETA